MFILFLGKQRREVLAALWLHLQSTTDAIFALRVLIEKYRGGQKERRSRTGRKVEKKWYRTCMRTPRHG